MKFSASVAERMSSHQWLAEGWPRSQ